MWTLLFWRRRHSAAFKAQLVKACQQAGVSSAAVALAHGLNANLLRPWVNDSERAGLASSTAMPQIALAPEAPKFVSLQLPATVPPPDIWIELQRGGVTVSITWPVAAASECAAWMREVLR